MSASSPAGRITGATVRRDFDDPDVVVHYTRAAAFLGLWASEWSLIERWLPDRDAPLLDAGCGAGRAALALWDLGYRRLTGVDFSGELIEQARGLAAERGAAIEFLYADVTRWRLPRLRRRHTPRPSHRRQGEVCHLLNDEPTDPAASDICHLIDDKPAVAKGGESGRRPDRGRGTEAGEARFAGVLFLFNGLMQIPGRARRRLALRRLRAACRPEAVLLFTTHDRDDGARERRHWVEEAERWARGEQDPRLHEFGDRYFRDDHGGHTFMHLPTRDEIREDLAATGWEPRFDAMRREVAVESAAVREFSDECRFWVAQRVASAPP